MAAAEVLTWDDEPSRRPSLEDVGGAACLDDSSKPPPRDGTHLYANLVNQLMRQVHALAKMVPSVRLTVSTAPVITTLESPISTLIAGDFTVTSGGTGITNISWVAGTLPTVSAQPTGAVTSAATNAVSWTAERVTAVSIQVRTYEAGVLAARPFVVNIY